MESEKQQEHELQWLREHLTMLLHVLLEAKRPPLGPGEAGGWEAPQAAELLRRCEALEKKTATFENIVCVLNREVERVAMTAEACGRQHRLDQDRIKALSHKVCARGQGCAQPGRCRQRLDLQRGLGLCRAPSRPVRCPPTRQRGHGCAPTLSGQPPTWGGAPGAHGAGARLRGWPRAASGARELEEVGGVTS